MLVLAHRGYHPSCPENTLEAFAGAVELGVDGIETDVRLSRDGVPVLLHDRLAADGRDVAELTAAELSAAAGYLVPSLEVALATSPSLLWNLEVKVPAALGPTLSLVRRHAGRHRFLVSSFWHPLVEPFAGIEGVECGLLMRTRPSGLAAFAAQFPAAAGIRTAIWYYEVLDPPLLVEVAAAGFRSFAYGTETPEEHRRCAGMELAGVITNRPDLLLAGVTPGPAAAWSAARSSLDE